ncbi:bifunctional DNA-formamidopyrimidine glycosylase/DNA-(apurinic or apyrimidinic site) lyase [Thermodesulfobacteriota bacterium]|jgi:formamidopyrimidine-DNA glycosylase|nr:bifunctional DNA-formamidopyrimidine glycosylase/DNA-(apurinic or apyrimidinic site) lyase [Desulfobulbales bacterium]
MPELPEVEVIRRGLHNHLPGCKVLGIVAGNKKLRLPMPRKYLKNHIQGARIKSVDRRAKFLLIAMDNGASLIVHLGMTGRLGLFPTGTPRTKHDHLRLLLDNNMQLRFNDSRRFGFIQVLAPGRNFMNTMLANLGPEPLGIDFTPEYLQSRAVGKNRPLKNFLMDSREIAGIGNIYACEILFHAGINPAKKICRLTMKEWTRVVASSKHVLQQAIESGGTTISDFVNESGKSGYFQLKLQAYGKQGKPCNCCSTPIAQKTMAGRSTFFCPKCQK